ncbi:MAG: hypothetical protein GX115_16615 [Ruminiclostridium sp.]|nr:hypothetical protein [Ruminiclostridium sp.]
MKQKSYSMHKNRIFGFLIRSTKGNALPLVLMLVMVVMLVGGSVAYSTMQMYNITRDGYHDQLAYIAAENALEKSIGNLQLTLAVPGYPGNKGVFFTGNVNNFLNSLVNKINSVDDIQRSYTIKVHDNLNEASVSVNFQRYGPEYTYTANTLTFKLQIEATADMVDDTYSSYSKKAVAVREFSIPLYRAFTLNGAVYSLGDLRVTSGYPLVSDYEQDTLPENYSTIEGDVYVFGTGLDKANRMQQYYTGGVCGTANSVLHVKGSIFTQNLVRAGRFDDLDGGTSSIIVDEDILAQSIQVFGTNDNIVVIGDAYTFDDVEMNGPNSAIAINGNYFGLNPGDGFFHDSSSAIMNMAPMYVYSEDYLESRIAVNGNIFATGLTFRVEGGEAGHKMESVSMTWRYDADSGKYKPLHIYENIPAKDLVNPDQPQIKYNNALFDPLEDNNGFSVLWKLNWDYDNTNAFTPARWDLWDNWVQEISNTADYASNNLTGKLPAASELQGFCHYGIAANNDFYAFDKDDETISKVKRASTVAIPIVNKIIDYEDVDTLDFSTTPWTRYTDWKDTGGSFSNNMMKLMGDLKPLVNVFAQKEINTGDGAYDYQYISATSQTEFNRIMNLVGDTAKFPHDPFDRCIVRYGDDGDEGTVDGDIIIDLNDELDAFDMNNDDIPVPPEPYGDLVPTDDYQSYHFLVVNMDPDREIHITDDFYGIIFSKGKVVIEKDGAVHGAIIAAGKGYDDSARVAGSSADVYYTMEDDPDDPDDTPTMIKKTRLPRVVISDDPDIDTVDNFRSWDYVGVEIENGGDIFYPGNVELLTALKNNINVDYGTGTTNRSIDLFGILNVPEP